jgi:hypothetical protein
LRDAVAQTFSPDVWDQELAVEERIDASIYRATKHLMQCKAIKQLSSQTPAADSRLPGS